MLALVLAMIICVALGAGVVIYVLLEARREGRGEFWTPEGEQLIAGARRTGERVRTRGEQLGRGAAERTQAIRERHAARRAATAQAEPTADEVPEARTEPAAGGDLRAAS